MRGLQIPGYLWIRHALDWAKLFAVLGRCLYSPELGISSWIAAAVVAKDRGRLRDLVSGPISHPWKRKYIEACIIIL